MTCIMGLSGDCCYDNVNFGNITVYGPYNTCIKIKL